MPGRTGSSHIIEKLDSHPAIVAKGELFGGNDVAAGAREVEPKLSKLYRIRNPFRTRAVGFKTKIHGTQNPVFEDPGHFQRLLAEDLGIDESLVLLRRNVVRQAVSRLRTEILKQDSVRQGGQKLWNVTRDDQRVPRCVVDPDQLDHWIDRYSKDAEELLEFSRGLAAEPRIFYYEDMLANEQEFFREMLECLGVPPFELTSDLIKHTPNDLSESIENFDQLVERYRDTPYEAMFLEGVV